MHISPVNAIIHAMYQHTIEIDTDGFGVIDEDGVESLILGIKQALSEIESDWATRTPVTAEDRLANYAKWDAKRKVSGESPNAS